MTSAARLVLVSTFVAALAACSSTPMTPAPAAATTPAPVGPPAAARPAAPAPAPAPVAASTVATVTLPPHLDPRSPIATERSVFFDYDDFTIKPAYTALLDRHGRYLAGQAALAIRIEGHADERGSKEYNLALGQKRAEAVLRALKIQGVRDAQMEAVSWGEERPRATGHDEAAWAQNRRADLLYPAR